jgi:RNA polymerase sigma-54 factor
MPYRGTLQINPLFRQAVNEVDQSKVEQWKADLDRASLLVKCLKQRYFTMKRLMLLLTKTQREFILKGDSWLLPLTRAEVAKKLDVHEATISRAVAGKIVQVPNGHLIPLSKFFDRSLHIRAELRRIISEEPEPLSDTQIMSKLKSRGYIIARRTVAKYRAMEGILPARLRYSS